MCGEHGQDLLAVDFGSYGLVDDRAESLIDRINGGFLVGTAAVVLLGSNHGGLFRLFVHDDAGALLGKGEEGHLAKAKLLALFNFRRLLLPLFRRGVLPTGIGEKHHTGQLLSRIELQGVLSLRIARLGVAGLVGIVEHGFEAGKGDIVGILPEMDFHFVSHVDDGLFTGSGGIEDRCFVAGQRGDRAGDSFGNFDGNNLDGLGRDLGASFGGWRGGDGGGFRGFGGGFHGMFFILGVNCTDSCCEAKRTLL